MARKVQKNKGKYAVPVSYKSKDYRGTIMYYFFPEIPVDRSQCVRGELVIIEDLIGTPKAISTEGYIKYIPRVYSVEESHILMDAKPIKIPIGHTLAKIYKNKDLYKVWCSTFIRNFYNENLRDKWSTRTEFYYKCYRNSYLKVIDYKVKLVYEMKWEFIEACLIQWHRGPYKGLLKVIPPDRRANQKNPDHLK